VNEAVRLGYDIGGTGNATISGPGSSLTTPDGLLIGPGTGQHWHAHNRRRCRLAGSGDDRWRHWSERRSDYPPRLLRRRRIADDRGRHDQTTRRDDDQPPHGGLGRSQQVEYGGVEITRQGTPPLTREGNPGSAPASPAMATSAARMRFSPSRFFSIAASQSIARVFLSACAS
jgi:T5SS/PEP-CTERM-associated repeat protein